MFNIIGQFLLVIAANSKASFYLFIHIKYIVPLIEILVLKIQNVIALFISDSDGSMCLENIWNGIQESIRYRTNEARSSGKEYSKHLFNWLLFTGNTVLRNLGCDCIYGLFPIIFALQSEISSEKLVVHGSITNILYTALWSFFENTLFSVFKHTYFFFRLISIDQRNWTLWMQIFGSNGSNFSKQSLMTTRFELSSALPLAKSFSHQEVFK